MDSRTSNEEFSSIATTPIRKFIRSDLIFVVQVIVILIVVITSIANLTVQNGNMNLWTALLSSCMGYVLPSPKLKDPRKKL